MQLQLDNDDVQRIAAAVVELLGEKIPAGATEWMGTTEISAHLRMSVDAVHRLSAAGVIPHFKVNGRLLFDRADVDAWVRSQSKDTPMISQARNGSFQSVSID